MSEKQRKYGDCYGFVKEIEKSTVRSDLMVRWQDYYREFSLPELRKNSDLTS